MTAIRNIQLPEDLQQALAFVGILTLTAALIAAGAAEARITRIDITT
jgi:branched-subunit amino acid transport protein